MPKCQNCGDHVSKRYARVLTPPGVDEPRTCPNCDLIRNGAEIRERNT